MIISNTVKFLVVEENIMLFTKPIYDNIIFHLADKKDFTIQTLHKEIIKKENISLPNFYKIIDHMVQYQILSKEK